MKILSMKLVVENSGVDNEVHGDDDDQNINLGGDVINAPKCVFIHPTMFICKYINKNFSNIQIRNFPNFSTFSLRTHSTEGKRSAAKGLRSIQ